MSRSPRPHLVRALLVIPPLALAGLLLVGCAQPESSDSPPTAAIVSPMPPSTMVGGGMPMTDAAVGQKDAAVDRSIVRTSTITVRVPSLDEAADRWRTAIAALGGIVTDEYRGDDGTTASASITGKVPADRLDEAVDAARGLGEPLSTSTSATDVTLAVTDLNARITVLETSMARLRALLDEATAVADVVAVETELTNRQAELDSLTAQQRVLEDQVAMAAITASLVPAVTPPGASAPGFIAGLQNGWNAILAAAGSATTVLGFVLPFALVIGALAAAVVTVARLVRRRSRHARPDAPARDHAGAAPRGDAHGHDDPANG